MWVRALLVLSLLVLCVTCALALEDTRFHLTHGGTDVR